MYRRSIILVYCRWHENFGFRVSSTLNRDVKQFGKKYLIDGDDETCWNSDQGSPQWIEIGFDKLFKIKEVHITFQGGFVGRECFIEGLLPERTEYIKLNDFFPEDLNSPQVFQLTQDTEVTGLRLVFQNSTDFFGRITIYKLDVIGL